MFCLRHCKILRSIKAESMKINFCRLISVCSKRNSIQSCIYDLQTYKFHNARKFSICLQKRVLNNYNVTLIDTSQRRNFSLESVAQTQAALFKYLSECTAVEYMQNFIILTHDTTGLPWWASIILTTCFFRFTVTVPLALYQNFITAKIANLTSEMSAILEELKLETAVAVRKFHLTENQAKLAFARSAKKQWTKLVERDNCHPVKASLLIWFQIPMWVVISISLRNIVQMLPHGDAAAQIRFIELSVGGCLWFPNLTVPDSFILPISLGLVNLAIIEIQSLMRTKEKSKLQRYVTNFFRGFSILMIPIAASVPSALTLYWTTSSVFGLCQNLVLMSPSIKRFVGIPQTKKDVLKPYTHLMMQIKNQFKL